MHATLTHASRKASGLATLALLGLAATTTAHAGTYTYTGTTVGGPTFNRPLAGTPPTSLSGVGTAVTYSVFTFTVDQAGSYVFQSTTVLPVNWDNYTFLYGGTFSPTAPLTNALTGNDDNPSIGQSGFTYSLATGTSYKFITAGFANTDAGSFSNVVTGPGNVIAAPEPSETAGFGLGMLGLSALAITVRKRRPSQPC